MRPIPAVVVDLFVVDDSVPSGLVWRHDTKNGKSKAGSMAGSLLKGTKNKYQVSVQGHGLYYTHRIAYYIKHNENPGSMVVRHLRNGNLALGWQNDNGRDVYGSKKKPDEGYTTATMYSYAGRTYNLKKLCEHLGLVYGTVYQKIKRTKKDYKEVFESYGTYGVDKISSSAA